MKNKSHLNFLAIMAKVGGDYNIGTTPVTTKKFSMIKTGPSGATVSVCKIRGVDVVTERNYGTLPAGYEIVAGGDDYIDAITLTAGNAQGVIYEEELSLSAISLVVAGGVENASMTPVITFTNGYAGSCRVFWRLRNSLGVIVKEGEKIVYFLTGTNITVNIPGLTHHSVAGEGYTFEIALDMIDKSLIWIECDPFEVTASEE